jgi:hypothetical protein
VRRRFGYLSLPGALSVVAGHVNASVPTDKTVELDAEPRPQRRVAALMAERMAKAGGRVARSSAAAAWRVVRELA